MEATKRCKECEQVKPLEAFGKRKVEKDGLHYNCKECLRRLYYRGDVPTPVPEGLKRCGRCKEDKPFEEFAERKAASDGRFPYCRVCVRTGTVPTAKKDEESFTGVCECCGKPIAGRTKNWDHNHITGKFRGWLCNHCNTGIGMLGDNLEGVRMAVAYLERFEDGSC